MKGKKIIAKIVSTALLFTIIFLPLEVLALNPSSSTIYQGIDVSQWQGNIDYRKVKNAGIQIVYMKSSEGTTYTDPYFSRNYEKAKANGLKVGFYHYVRARSVDAARREAEYFAKVIQGKEVDCRLAMDFESFGSLSNSQINSISKAFLERLYELTKKELVIYSNTYSARRVFSREIANRYPLWVAQYGPSQPSNNGKWSSWVGFQYTNTGRVSGINGNVDRDRFTKEILLKNVGKIPIVPDKDINKGNNTNIRYRVKRGDTLSEIAQKYGTTVSKIARDNNISNINRIYVGQKLIIRSEYIDEIHDCGHCIYTVKWGDTLSRIAKKYDTTINSIVRLNNIRNVNKIYVGDQLRIKGKCNCK